jgi:hypothetical protein
VRGEGYQHLAAVPVDDQIAALCRSVDADHAAESRAVRVAHFASDQIAVTICPFGQRSGRRCPDRELRAGERFGLVDRLDALEGDDRPSLVESDVANCSRRGTILRSDQQDFANGETLLGEIRLGIDDHLAAIAVRSRDASDQQQIVHLRQ